MDIRFIYSLRLIPLKSSFDSFSFCLIHLQSSFDSFTVIRFIYSLYLINLWTFHLLSSFDSFTVSI